MNTKIIERWPDSPVFSRRGVATFLGLLPLWVWIGLAAEAPGSTPPLSRPQQIVFGCYTEDFAQFRRFAERAKALGATHITITAEDLPLAYWELAPPGDPYPAWVITNPGLLKIAPPAALRGYIPPAHGEEVMGMLEARCRILRELGLKAAFHTFEPQMLPERVFADHPEWRGPRVDHPRRSRTPRFAPSISNPEVLGLYQDALGQLLDRCPEIEILQMRTSDSGAGVDWSASLYAGANGPAASQGQEMSDRVRDFLNALQRAARERKAELHVNLFNLRDKEQKSIVAKLGAGMAVEDQEGPDGSPFKFDVGSLYSGLSLLYYRRPFAPACGIPWPASFLEALAETAAARPQRLFVAIGDRHNLDLYLRIYESFLQQPAMDATARVKLLHGIAAEQVGEAHASRLVEVWAALQAAEKLHRAIRGGGTVFILGAVHQRWITRPFVPFPHRLTPEETNWWRPFQFQAGEAAGADDLMNSQGDRLPEINGGYDQLITVLQQMRRHVDQAASILAQITPQLTDGASTSCQLLSQRLSVFTCLLNNAGNAVAYQRELDAIATSASGPERPAPAESRANLARIALEEIANTRRLVALLEAEHAGSILDRATAPGQEYQRLLGHDIREQLLKKIVVMDKHRND